MNFNKGKMLWNLLVLLKVKCFDWLLLRERVAARNRLQVMGVAVEEGNVYAICGEVKVDCRHFFFTVVGLIGCGRRLLLCRGCKLILRVDFEM